MTKKFMGVPYPIMKNALGFFYSQDGMRQIKSDLLTLLLTNPGERVYLPTFGTPLRKLMFEPNDPGLAIKARQMIIDSIRTWEPRVAVQQIQVTNTIDRTQANAADDTTQLDAVLHIKIIFVDPEAISEVQQLTLEVPLSGG
jgi:phage baseplate assembly protein W